jgi:hypothetical protein
VLIFVNCIFTAGYLLAIKGAKDQTNLNTFGLMFYNNLFSFPLYVVIVACTELTDILKYDRWTDVGFLVGAPLVVLRGALILTRSMCSSAF